jgi:hypothetical protein
MSGSAPPFCAGDPGKMEVARLFPHTEFEE